MPILSEKDLVAAQKRVGVRLAFVAWSTVFIGGLILIILMSGCDIVQEPADRFPACDCNLDYSRYDTCFSDAILTEERDVYLWQSFECTPEPVIVEPEVEKGIESLSDIEVRANHRGSGQYWDISVSWTPRSEHASCRWRATSSFSYTPSVEGRGSCATTLKGTPSAGDTIRVDVTDDIGETHSRGPITIN